MDPRKPYAFFVENERSISGDLLSVATIFLTNRECPWRCAMCDLWRNTLTETVPIGAIPQQIDYALARLAPARQIKLYNSGSFFDLRAIPEEDYPAIAERSSQFERTIVECHPALIGDRCLRFRDLLKNPFEIALGLETSHPEVLEKLNKRITLDLFARAAEFLRRNAIDLRVFILVQPPFLPKVEALDWAMRSMDFAFDCGATAITLIPTRGGNGAMERFAETGSFTPPELKTLEAAAEYGIRQQRGRIFADTWDLRTRTNACLMCLERRIARLELQNLSQCIEARVECSTCGGDS
ncbi:radical SAM protein [Silvibacterium acidisoli]|uniref:radical SAM protein n=1 Tax=Acidobacteriaceae bacterium ZG23-2 TaxID=2883246 RepID=UPI00406BEEF7